MSTIRRKLLNINICPTSSPNMVNFDPLAAEICWRAWGTPANFKEFRVLAALLHGTLVVGVSQTLRRWTEGATYIRQGCHHVGHSPTFLVIVCYATAVVSSSSSFFLYSFFLAYSQRSQIRCLYHTSTCGLSANLECRSEMCSTLLAENTERKNSPKIRHLRTIAQLCLAISSQQRHVSTVAKTAKQQ